MKKNCLQKWISCLFIGLLCSPSAFGQYRFQQATVYDEDRDMPSAHVTAIQQDQDGFIWVGTRKGLVRLDGMDVQLFQHVPSDSTSLPHNSIADLYYDAPSKQLYVTTANGMGILNLLNHKFEVVREGDGAGPLATAEFTKIHKDKQGQIWMGTNRNGLALFDPHKKSFSYLPHRSLPATEAMKALKKTTINGIQSDLQNDSLLWLATSNGLFEFNKFSLQLQQHLYPATTDREKRYINNTRSIHVHQSGLYLGTSYMGLIRFDPLTRQFNRVKGFEPIRKQIIQSFHAAPDGRFWVNTNRGTQLYDPFSKTLIESYTNQSKVNKFYAVDFIDQQARIWNKNSDRGLVCFSPSLQQFQNIDLPYHEFEYPPNTSAFVEDPANGLLYLTSNPGQGVFRYDQKKKEFSTLYFNENNKAKHQLSIVNMLQMQNGQILLNNDSILYTLSDEKIRPFPYQINNRAALLRQTVEDSKGHLWISSQYEGVYRLNPKTGQIRQFKEELNIPQEDRNFFGASALMLDSKDRLWIQTSTGFSVFNPLDQQFHTTALSHEEGQIVYGKVHSFHEDQSGRIWVCAGDEGLLYIDPQDVFSQKISGKITYQNNLRNKAVYQVLSDVQNNLWISGDEGLEYYILKDSFTNFFSYNYGLSSSMSSLDYFSTGEIVAKTKQGLQLFHPDSLRKNKELPEPYITSFRVFDQELPTDTFLYKKDRIQLSYQQNFFTIEFSAINFNLSDQTSFQYRLNGFDRDWIYAGKGRNAAYTNVPGGHYTFQIRAINNEGLLNAKPYTIDISITIPWWKTLWFRGLLFFSLLGIGIYAYQSRTSQIRQQERLKAEFERKLANTEMSALRAQMSPHFVFNCLNSIDYYILQNETEKASDYLNRFSRLIRLILQNSRSRYIGLKDELEALKLYIEMESLRFDNRFDYVVRMEKGLNTQGIEIPPMLLQPYIENAIWHGLMQKKGKGLLQLTITKDEDMLHCTIQDNGIGREAAQELKSKTGSLHKSFGMKITQDRLEIINRLYDTRASVEVEDLKDSNNQATGTKVYLKIPI